LRRAQHLGPFADLPQNAAERMYAVLLRSAASAFEGVRLRWQKLRRRGDFSYAPIDRVVAGAP